MKYLIAAAIAAFFFLAANVASAQTLPNEISATNGEDEIILTVEPCPAEENHGFINYAYVMRKGNPEPIAVGCWKDDGVAFGMPVFDIWMPAIKSHFQMFHKEFKPRNR